MMSTPDRLTPVLPTKVREYWRQPSRASGSRLATLRAPHRHDRIGVQATERHRLGAGLLHAIAKDGHPDVTADEYRSLGERGLDACHALGVLGEALVAKHEI